MSVFLERLPSLVLFGAVIICFVLAVVGIVRQLLKMNLGIATFCYGLVLTGTSYLLAMGISIGYMDAPDSSGPWWITAIAFGIPAGLFIATISFLGIFWSLVGLVIVKPDKKDRR